MSHPDNTSRAKVALAKKFSVSGPTGKIDLNNFPMGAVVRLHDIRSPLFYGDGCAVGLFSGWLASAYLLACEPEEIMGKGVDTLFRDAAKWALQFTDTKWVFDLAAAMKAQWSAINDLDPPDIAKKDGEPESKN